MNEGYVDRVLTTNFDLLVTQAAALLHQFPASYDLATSEVFKPGAIAGKAVFHLHGRYTGFVQINTAEEIANHAKLVGPAVDEAGVLPSQRRGGNNDSAGRAPGGASP